MGSFFSFVYSKIPHNTRYTTRPNKKGRVFFSSQSLWYFDTISDVMDQRYQLKKRIWLSIINGKSLNLDQLLELKTYVNLLLRHGIWSFEGTICWLSRALWKSTIWSFGSGRYHRNHVNHVNCPVYLVDFVVDGLSWTHEMFLIRRCSCMKSA